MRVFRLGMRVDATTSIGAIPSILGDESNRFLQLALYVAFVLIGILKRLVLNTF